MSTHLFGIRHHGPGCARSLRAGAGGAQAGHRAGRGAARRARRAAADAPQGDDAAGRAADLRARHAQPGGLLSLHAFSPEWQALDYAFKRDSCPARFIDLPQAIQLAREPEAARATRRSARGANGRRRGDDQRRSSRSASRRAGAGSASPREDPLALLAQAAGYDDHELWWERQIEQRRDMVGLFDGILEAMTALRADTTPRDEEEAQREAQMRQGIRAAQQEGFKRIAVVSGAWHSPALGDLSDAKGDARC